MQRRQEKTEKQKQNKTGQTQNKMVEKKPNIAIFNIYKYIIFTGII